MVEKAAQNDMLNCLKRFTTRAGKGSLGVWVVSGRAFASEDMAN